MQSIRITYILVSFLAGTTALAVGWTSDIAWFLAGVAALCYARCARSTYLLVQGEAFHQNPSLVLGRAERLYVGVCLGAGCFFVVSFFSKGGWLSAGAIAYTLADSVLHLFFSRKLSGPQRSGPAGTARLDSTVSPGFPGSAPGLSGDPGRSA